MDFRKVMVWAVTIFVAAVMFLSGFGKIVQMASWQQQFAGAWGLPGWLAPVTGVVEIAGAALLVVPRRAVFGGALIVLVMIGASGAHIMAGELGRLPVTATLGALAALVAWYRCSWCAP